MDNYHTYIPEPLNSRFDMKYFFTPLNPDEKTNFIQVYSKELFQSLEDEFKISFDKEKIKRKLKELVEYDNLRDIKRNIENIIISEMELSE